MEGALRAFATLPREITASHQLVLNDVGDEALFRNKARLLGLADADIVVFKRRSDEELGILYNLCKLFIFPSLYEGFGLPVLEAMTCGAPVIASNNSSLPEVVGRADALFDASNNQSITDAMYKSLTNDPFREDLATFGFARSKQFSWQNTAQRAWDALESLQGKKYSPEVGAISSSGRRPRIRLAHVSPLPPQKSGVAEYSAVLLPYLAAHCDIDLFTEPGLQVSDQVLSKNFAIYPWTELIARRDDYDAVLYQMGNSELHIPMLDLLKEVPGVVVCHDFFFSNLPFVKEIRTGERGHFQRDMDYSHGLRGVVEYLKHGVEAVRWEWPVNWRVLKYAQEVIVHSEHQNELIQKFYAYGWKPRPTIIKHLHEAVPVVLGSEKLEMRRQLGLPAEAFIYCSFGFLAPTKMNKQVIQAFSQVLSNIKGEAILIFVGELDGESEYGKDLRRILQDLKLTNKVRITGYLNKADYEKYLRCADVAVQLRKDSRGETSGALLECMAFGLPAIINSHGSFNDYDDDTVFKLSEFPDPQELSDAMIRLNVDSPYRREIGQRARALIIDQYDPLKAASAYADVIRKAAAENERRLFDPLVNSLIGLGSPLALQQSSAQYAAAHLALRCQPRLLVDTTRLQGIDFRESGAQAAIQLIKEFFATIDKAVHIELVYVVEGRWLRACRLTEKIFDLPKFGLGSEAPVIVQPGDVLLLIDSSGDETISPPGIFEIFRQRGGRIAALGDRFLEGLVAPEALECDIFICTSRGTAEEVKANICGGQTQLRRSLDIFFPKSVEDYSIKDGAGATTEGLKGQRKESHVFNAANMVSSEQRVRLIMAGIFGGRFRDSISVITIKPESLALSHPGDQHVLLEVNGENIGGVSRNISFPRSKGFSIVMDEKAVDGISASIVSNNYELPLHYHMLLDLVPVGGNVLDLGAHIGTFSLFAAANGYDVISVEASPRNSALLNASIRRNGFDNIKVVTAAVTDHSGSLIFYEDGPYGAVANSFIGDSHNIHIPAITVDSMLADFDMDHVDLIKMDIEGSEVAAVQGMPKLLSGKFSPCILFESNGHTLNFFGLTPQDLVSSLEAFGYQCYHLYSGKLYLIKPDELQLECVADCLAVKKMPEAFADKWKMVPPMSFEEKITVALGEMSFHNPDVRAYIGRILKSADLSFLEDGRISSALNSLLADTNAFVRESVGWWHLR